MAFKTEDLFQSDNQDLNVEIGTIRIEGGGLTIDWTDAFLGQVWQQQLMFCVVLSAYLKYMHDDLHVQNCKGCTEVEGCAEGTVH